MPTYQRITTMKNKGVSLLGVLTVLALAAAVTHSTASAQTGANEDEVSRHAGATLTIQGSWIMTNKRVNQAGVTFTAVGSFSAGGTALFVGSIAAVPPLLHGAWARTDFNRFDSTVYFFAYDPTGKAVAMIKVNQVFHLDGRDQLVGSGGSYVCDLQGQRCVADPSFDIEITGTRIVPEMR